MCSHIEHTLLVVFLLIVPLKIYYPLIVVSEYSLNLFLLFLFIVSFYCFFLLFLFFVSFFLCFFSSFESFPSFFFLLPFSSKTILLFGYWTMGFLFPCVHRQVTMSLWSVLDNVLMECPWQCPYGVSLWSATDNVLMECPW